MTLLERTDQTSKRAFCTQAAPMTQMCTSNPPQGHTRSSVEQTRAVGIIIEVRQSLCTTEGWALSVECLTMVAKEEVITRHWGTWQVLGKYSNNL